MTDEGVPATRPAAGPASGPSGASGDPGGPDGPGAAAPDDAGMHRAEVAAAACFLVAILAGIALTVVYWFGGQPQAEGLLLAAATGGIGAGIVLWAKRFMPGGGQVEERGRLASTPHEVAEFRQDFEAGEGTIRRRRLLVAMGGGACAMLGVAALFPIRSLGPRPGAGLTRTPYRPGRRVVREDGTPVHPDDLPIDGFITVWPEGHTDAADAPTLLIHVRPTQDFQVHEGRRGWTVDNIVAYSKICTHAGCPVGLYESSSASLLCPCHQSTFDVLRWATPVFGPAARPLPQLPLDVDGEGFLVATGDFSDPVGPGFWDRGR